MILQKNALSILSFWIAIVFITPNLDAQTKRLKRPKSRVGVSSVDTFVRESFDIYDKVYKYDGYAESGTPLDDEDIDVLEDALDDLSGLSDSAPDILSDLGGLTVLKQAKATLQINKAKKALKYSVKTAKELLLGQRKRDKKENEPNEESEDDNTSESDDSQDTLEDSNVSDNLEVYSKYDFVPGDKLLFYDDFAKDFIGDFPSKWNTNGGGEIVTINQKKWFELLSGNKTFYIPDVKTPSEDYTIEFDILTKGIDKKTSSYARLNIYLDNSESFNFGKTYVKSSLPFCQYVAQDIQIENFVNNDAGDIKNGINADIRAEVLNNPHIAIAVNKQRYRLWVNHKKYIDVPRIFSPNHPVNQLKFNVTSFKDGKEQLFITNIKVTEGGVDLRRQLLSEGKISTNGILFDSGSANIQPQSYGIIRQISQVLMQDEVIKLKIVGHTDADGTEDSNLKLSKARAGAVKKALITIYKISENRLQIGGKGESVPVADNNTTDGKAQNRRVEFIKL